MWSTSQPGHLPRVLPVAGQGFALTNSARIAGLRGDDAEAVGGQQSASDKSANALRRTSSLLFVPKLPN
jgi:hypothetical protein